MTISRRLGAIEKRLGLDASKPQEERPEAGYLMQTSAGLVECRTGDRMTREEAESRFPVIYTMPDNGRDPDLPPMNGEDTHHQEEQ